MVFILEKRDIRKIYRAKRYNILNKEEKSKIIVSKIVNSKFFIEAETVALYAPFDGETDLFDLFPVCKRMNKSVCFPAITGKGKMQFCYIEDLKSLHAGAFHILEPSGNKICSPNSIDLILVPGICFDNNMHRIGYGGGYYDKYLSGVHATKMGICFSGQIFAGEFPFSEGTDIPMDLIICEKCILSSE